MKCNLNKTKTLTKTFSLVSSMQTTHWCLRQRTVHCTWKSIIQLTCFLLMSTTSVKSSVLNLTFSYPRFSWGRSHLALTFQLSVSTTQINPSSADRVMRKTTVPGPQAQAPPSPKDCKLSDMGEVRAPQFSQQALIHCRSSKISESEKLFCLILRLDSVKSSKFCPYPIYVLLHIVLLLPDSSSYTSSADSIARSLAPERFKTSMQLADNSGFHPVILYLLAYKKFYVHFFLTVDQLLHSGNI